MGRRATAGTCLQALVKMAVPLLREPETQGDGIAPKKERISARGGPCTDFCVSRARYVICW